MTIKSRRDRQTQINIRPKNRNKNNMLPRSNHKAPTLSSILSSIDKEYDLLLYCTWLISLGLASRDISEAIDITPSHFLSLQYRTWLQVDGSFNLVLAVYSVISSCLVRLPTCSKNFILVKLFAFVCKLSWLVLGMYLFFSLDARHCSSTLLILSLLYYMAFGFVIFRALGKLGNLAGFHLSQDNAAASEVVIG